MRVQEITLRSGSAGTDTVSAPVLLNGVNGFSIQAVFTGSDVAGTIKLECSNDGTNWVTVTNSSQSITNSAGYIWDVPSVEYKYVRVNWDYTSGTGNLTVTYYNNGV